jgi:hypothetical protein
LYESGEGTSLHRTLNLLCDHVREHESPLQEQAMDELRMIRKWHKEAAKPHGLRIEMDGRNLTPKVLIEVFLYGRYLHKDQDKLALLEQAAPVALLQFEFLSTMQVLAKIYRCVGQEVVRPILKTRSLVASTTAT